MLKRISSAILHSLRSFSLRAKNQVTRTYQSCVTLSTLLISLFPKLFNYRIELMKEPTLRGCKKWRINELMLYIKWLAQGQALYKHHTVGRMLLSLWLCGPGVKWYSFEQGLVVGNRIRHQFLADELTRFGDRKMINEVSETVQDKVCLVCSCGWTWTGSEVQKRDLSLETEKGCHVAWPCLWGLAMEAWDDWDHESNSIWKKYSKETQEVTLE